MRNIFNDVRNNKIKSWLLMLAFIVLISLLGSVIGIWLGSIWFGLAIAILFSLIYSTAGFFSSDRMILTLSGAKPATKKEYPYLYHTVEAIAISAGIPAPKCYVIEDSALNAFATGRDPKNAAITVTTGLLKVMNRQELE